MRKRQLALPHGVAPRSKGLWAEGGYRCHSHARQLPAGLVPYIGYAVLTLLETVALDPLKMP
jgi:hypothetical protein